MPKKPVTEKNVLISILGRQTMQDELPQALELRTDGILRDNGDSLSLSYAESEVTGMEGVHTEFEIAQDKVLLKRSGKVNSTMVFQRGQKTESLYDMGFGALLVGVNSRIVETAMTMDGGSIDLNYMIEIEHEPVSVNVYHITVQDAN